MKVAAEAERLRAQGVDVVDFGAGEPTFPRRTTSSRPPSRARTEFHQVHQRRRHPGAEAGRLRTPCARISARLTSPSECLIAVGGKHVIFNFTQALLNPGDEVVIPVPYWVTYKDVVNYAGAKCVFVGYRRRARLRSHRAP